MHVLLTTPALLKIDELVYCDHSAVSVSNCTPRRKSIPTLGKEARLEHPPPKRSKCNGSGERMEGAETSLLCGGERIECVVTLSNHRHHLRPYS